MIGFGQARDRAERLLTLACVLQMGRPLSLNELRERFGLYTDRDPETTRRQFERDKQDLRGLGIEVVTRTLGDEDRYAIPSGLPAVAIDWTDEELLALATLSAAVGDEVSGSALAKVSFHRDVMPDERAAARIRIDLDVPPSLVDAQARRRRVTFPYRTATGDTADRVVEPWTIASRRAQTYVAGWDVDREASRVFRVDRIVGEVVDVGEASHPRPAPGEGPPLAPEDRSDVRLRVPEQRLPDAVAMGATVVAAPDGDTDAADDRTVEVELPAVRDETAIGWSLRHEAEVLAPTAIAEAVAARRDRIRELHTGDPSRPPMAGTAPTRRTRRAGLTEQRLTRLLALPEWLAKRPGVTVDEVATAFGCDVAEVRAELELIDDLEVPQLGYVGELTAYPDGQLEFLPWVGAPRASLTTVEAVHLLSLVEAALVLLPADAVPALTSVAERLRDHLGEDAASLALVELDTPSLGVLREVVGTDAEVAFAYRGRHDEQVEHRRVRPLQLQLLGGAVYLSAFDLDREEGRTFRLDRLHDVRVETAPTGPVDDRPREPDYVAVTDEVAVELALTTQATWILRLLPETHRVTLDDGRVHALVHTDVPDWLLAHVRAAGGQAELLRPAELRGALAG